MTSHVQRDYSFMEPSKVHLCCVTSCLSSTLLGYVACRHHWQALPASVRRDLAAAFRLREQDPELYAEAVAIAERLINVVAAGAA